MATKDGISAEQLRARLGYDKETGKFLWINSPRMGIKPGTAAGSLSKRFGYVIISLKGSNYMAHRLAWLHVYGLWPERGLDVDHIDGNRSNNRIENLRCVTRAHNLQNVKRAQRNSKSGLLGASFSKVMNRWEAYIGCGGSIFLGGFDSAQEAHEAYLVAKRKLHPGCMI